MQHAWLATVILLGTPLAAESQTARPNIVWLIAEDFGQHLGCYGTKEVHTPHLDRLAAEGVRYTHFYVGPVCSVSRSSFMTGMYATTIGAHNHRTLNKSPLPEGVRLLTSWLGEAGYFSANLVELPPACGFQGTGKTDWNFQTDGKPFDTSRWEDLPAHQPFYAQLNFPEAHRPHHAPRHADPAKVEIPPFDPEHPITRQDWAAYLDAATELDRKVGQVWEALEASGLADHTMIVFFADNGQCHVRGKQFCYEEGLRVPLIIHWPKHLPTPEHLKAGGVDSRLLQGIDLAPTMLDLAGRPKPPKMQGRIFLGEHCEPDQQYVFGFRDRCDMTVMRLRSVRDLRYRYIRNFTPWVPFLAFNQYKANRYPVWNLLPQLHSQGKLTPAQAFLCQPCMPEEELYDLDHDPWEIHNLASSDNLDDRSALSRLRGVLQQWIEKTNDQGRRSETLDELQRAEPRWVTERDWRPPPSAPVGPRPGK